jgi:hypothetical protein
MPQKFILNNEICQSLKALYTVSDKSIELNQLSSLKILCLNVRLDDSPKVIPFLASRFSK